MQGIEYLAAKVFIAVCCPSDIVGAAAIANTGKPSEFVSARTSSVLSTDPVCSASNIVPSRDCSNFLKIDEFKTIRITLCVFVTDPACNDEEPAFFSLDHCIEASLAIAIDDTERFKSFIISRVVAKTTSSIPVSSTKLTGI